MTTEELTKLYGLFVSPFRAKELDPVAGEDLKLYARVDGFTAEEPAIQQKAASLPPKSLILVYGPPGCGRSSVANYVIRHLPPVDGLQVQRIIGKVRDEEPMDGIRQVLENMREFLDDAGVFPNQKELEAKFMEHIANTDDPPPMGTAKDLFKASRRILLARKKNPIVVVEGVLSYKQVDNTATAFESADVLLFTSNREDIYNTFGSHRYPGFRVKVERLMTADIISFLDQRWRYAQKNESAVHPFETQGIHKAFDGRPWSFRTVSDIMEAAWRNHGAELSSSAPSAATVTAETILHAAWEYVTKGTPIL